MSRNKAIQWVIKNFTKRTYIELLDPLIVDWGFDEDEAESIIMEANEILQAKYLKNPQWRNPNRAKSKGLMFWLPIIAVTGGLGVLAYMLLKPPKGTKGLVTTAKPKPEAQVVTLNLLNPTDTMNALRSVITYQVTNKSGSPVKPDINFIFQKLDGAIWEEWPNRPTADINPGQTVELDDTINVAKGWTQEYPKNGIFTIQASVDGKLQDRIIRRVGLSLIA